MKQEEKSILFKDLCARLPYHPKCEMIDELRVVNNERDSSYISTLFPKHIELFSYHNNFTIKPYLRPMSSMTEEECDKVEEIIGNDCIFDFMGNGDIVLHKGNFTQKTLSKLYDFYNSIHVDYHTDDEGRTMIESGLAIEVTEGNNPYK